MSRIAQGGYEPDEIEVTPAMVSAGLDELREHSFGDEPSYVLESIYRAMSYAALSAASETNSSR